MSPSENDNAGFVASKTKQSSQDKIPVANSPLVLANFLVSHPQIWYIRYQWIDLLGILRVRILTKSHSLRLASTNSPIALGPLAFGFNVDESQLPDTKPIGSDTLYPDWTSLRETNFGTEGNRYASVMCWISESNCEEPDIGYRRCPRTILTRILKQAKESYNLDFLVGFEVEFMLMSKLENGDRYSLVSAAGQYTASSVRVQAFQYVEECVKALVAANIDVEQFHSEDSGGQFEISTGPLPVMDAIDTLILTHEIIKNVLAKHGHQATMYPKPFLDHPSNGAHTHLSICPPHMEEEFLAGLLHRLPSLCAFTMPNPDSYTRRRRREGGESVEWGSLNRSVPIRKIKPGHWEIRCVDATANMYLALAACISAGMLGVRDREELVWKDSSSSWYLKLSDEEKASLGIYKPLPKSPNEAVRHLRENSRGLEEIMGKWIIERYIQVKGFEEDVVMKLDPEKRRCMYLEQFS
ncbi:hypothetical protein MMC24_003978 [Lignoscripta atroalba]|nr:hypothetical protein [Lignoscripta atroalba]